MKKTFSVLMYLFILICLSAFGPPVSIDDLEKRLKEKPEDPATYVELATALKKEGRIDEAVKILDQALEISQSFAGAWYERADIHYRLGEYTEALEKALIAAALLPAKADFQGLLGKIYIKLDQIDAAIKKLELASQLRFGKAAYYHFLLARCYEQQGNYLKAAGHILEEIPSRPWDDTIYVRAAKMYYQAGDKKKGDLYKKRSGHTWKEYNDMKKRSRSAGWDMYAAGDYEGALTFFSNELSYSAKPAEQYWAIALCCRRMDSPLNAEYYFKKSVETDPSFYKAYSALGSLYDRLGKKENAVVFYNEALKINPKDPYSLTGLADISIREKDFKQAEIYFLKALDAKPADSAIHSQLGYVRSCLEEHRDSFFSYYHAWEHSRTGQSRDSYLQKALKEGLKACEKKSSEAKRICTMLLKILPDDHPDRVIITGILETSQ